MAHFHGKAGPILAAHSYRPTHAHAHSGGYTCPPGTKIGKTKYGAKLLRTKDTLHVAKLGFGVVAIVVIVIMRRLALCFYPAMKTSLTKRYI